MDSAIARAHNHLPELRARRRRHGRPHPGHGLEHDDPLYVVNLREHRLPLLTPTGDRWLIDVLQRHQTEALVVDPYGKALTYAGGDNENDNAQARWCCNGLDEIKRKAAVRSLFMAHHTGRGEQVEGEEHGRGATALDDWADVIFVLTKDKHGVRYLRSEGRAVDLEESRLGFDGARLMLASGDVGVNRAKARKESAVKAVEAAVKESPGMGKTDLRAALVGVGTNSDRDDAIAAAIAARSSTPTPVRGTGNSTTPVPLTTENPAHDEPA